MKYMKLDITATYSKKGFKYEKGNRIYLGNPFLFSDLQFLCVYMFKTSNRVW